MPILRAHNLLFVHVPRTAGTSIEKSLGICGVDNRGSNVESRTLLFGNDGTRFLQHLTAEELLHELGDNTFYGCYRFAFVRNPFARVLSVYHNYDGYCKRYSFSQFVHSVVPKEFKRPLTDDHSRHLKPMRSFVFSQEGKSLLNFIGRHETLNTDIESLARTLKVALVLPSSEKPPIAENYAEHYDPTMRAIVEDLFGCDLSAFDYRF